MIQGSSHPRTARSAAGQDIVDRVPFPSLIFFPPFPLHLQERWCGRFWLRGLQPLLPRVGSGVRGMIPTKGEGTPDESPVPPDGLVTSHLVLGPAQCMFDVFVALLHPHAQPVQPDHLF